MKLTDILQEKSVITNIKPQNKRALLTNLATIAAKETNIDERVIFDALLERENLGSTGLGNKVAIPHARIEGLNNVFVLFTALEKPIEFNAIDKNPIDLAFLLLSPENNGADHLTALACISRVIKNEELCKKLRNTNSAIEVYSLLKNTDAA